MISIRLVGLAVALVVLPGVAQVRADAEPVPTRSSVSASPDSARDRAAGSKVGTGRGPAESERAAEPPAEALAPDTLVEQVLQRNQGIDALRAAAAAADARVESAGALDDPLVTYAVAPNTAGGPRQGLNQNLQISQSLPWPGTLDLRGKAAEADMKSSEWQVADLRLQLTARARGNYAEWYYVHRALAINADNLALVRRLRSVAETAYASGRSPQQDILQAEVELIRLRNQALQLGRLRRTVQAKINALRNLDPGTEVPVPAGPPAEAPLPEIAALRAAAPARHPMLQSLDARIAAGRSRLDLALKGRYPNFNLIAGYNSFLDAPDKRLSVGVGVNIPFGGNHRGQIGEARARLREAEAQRADARARLLGDLDQAYAAASQAAETIRLYTEHLLPLAELNLRAAEADYSAGAGDFLKLITAEQQALTAKLELARARADFFIHFAALDYRTGGSLTAPHSQDPMP